MARTQETSGTAGAFFQNWERGRALLGALADISALDNSAPAQLLDPARAIKTRWAIDRQPRQLQQDAVIMRTLSGCFCGVQRAPFWSLSRSRTGTAWRKAHLAAQNTMPICHAPAMTVLHDAHGILDAAQNLQLEVGASPTWTGAGLSCALALPAGPMQQAHHCCAAELDAQTGLVLAAAPASNGAGSPLSTVRRCTSPRHDRRATSCPLLKLLLVAFPRRAPLNCASVTSIGHPPTETRRRVPQARQHPKHHLPTRPRLPIACQALRHL